MTTGRQKTLIHIGGSYLQLPGIRAAKEVGMRVVLTDAVPDVPGRQFCDTYERISGSDVAGLLDLAGRIARTGDLAGIYCGSDFGLPAVAAVSEEHRLPGPGRRTVEIALNKSLSRQAFLAAGLPCPEGSVVRDLPELGKKVEQFGWPAIIKPAGSSGSRGVRSVWTAEEGYKAFAEAKSLSDEVIVERVVRGHHADVNGLFLGGDFFPCGILDRFFSEPPYHYPVWGCQPSALGEPVQHEINNLIREAGRVLGLRDGPIKADVVVSEGGPVILEAAPRFHGDVSTSRVSPACNGGNPIKAWLGRLSGLDHPERLLEPAGPERVAGWMAIFPERPGRLREIRGVEEARAVEGVFDLYIRARPGQILERPEDNRAVCGFVWATAPDRSALRKALESARRSVVLEVS